MAAARFSYVTVDRSVLLVLVCSFRIIVSVPGRVSLVPAPCTVSCKLIICSRLKNTEKVCCREGCPLFATGI